MASDRSADVPSASIRSRSDGRDVETPNKAVIVIRRLDAGTLGLTEGMLALADYGDDPAIAVYTKLGIREDVMHFDIAIPDWEIRSRPACE